MRKQSILAQIFETYPESEFMESLLFPSQTTQGLSFKEKHLSSTKNLSLKTNRQSGVTVHVKLTFWNGI